MKDCEDCQKSVTMEARIVRLETAYELHREGTDKALSLQAKEYDRRLNELNGEASRILSVQTHSVTRELFDYKIEELTERFRDIKSWQDNWVGRNTVIIAVVALLASAVAVVIARWLVP